MAEIRQPDEQGAESKARGESRGQEGAGGKEVKGSPIQQPLSPTPTSGNPSPVVAWDVLFSTPGVRLGSTFLNLGPQSGMVAFGGRGTSVYGDCS